MILKLYVGCALTVAPPEFRAEVEQLKDRLDGRGLFEVMRFLGLEKGTPNDVFRVDMIEGVGACQLMLAVCDYPSIGLGMELLEAVKVRRIPVLAVNKAGSTVTRLLTGMGEFYPNLKFANYESLVEDVPAFLSTFAKEVVDDLWDHELGGPRWAFRPVRGALDDDPT